MAQKPADRTELLDILIKLTPEQFDLLVAFLNINIALLPGQNTAQSKRVTALLLYAEAPGGCGLDQIKQALNRVIKQ